MGRIRTGNTDTTLHIALVNNIIVFASTVLVKLMLFISRLESYRRPALLMGSIVSLQADLQLLRRLARQQAAWRLSTLTGRLQLADLYWQAKVLGTVA